MVNDFRSADVAAGGQGAPLRAALSSRARRRAGERPLVVVNIGGVANVTYVGADDTVIAFDTGPGNAPLDDWALAPHRRAGRQGRRAGARRPGRRDACSPLMLGHPHISPCRRRNRSTASIFRMTAVRRLSPADGAATLTAFTAASIARAREHFPA